jgi:O-antigen/teichoic acid export membrane protein
LISNTIYFFLDWFVLTLAGFLYWFIAGKTLLPEEYGIISTSTNLAIVLSGMSLLGLGAAYGNLYLSILQKNREEKLFL